MSDRSLDFIDDILPEEPNGELVHWMEPKPMSLGAMGVTAATAGAFALGVAATLAVVAVLRLRDPEATFALADRFRKRRDA